MLNTNMCDSSNCRLVLVCIKTKSMRIQCFPYTFFCFTIPTHQFTPIGPIHQCTILIITIVHISSLIQRKSSSRHFRVFYGCIVCWCFLFFRAFLPFCAISAAAASVGLVLCDVLFSLFSFFLSFCLCFFFVFKARAIGH